MDFLPYLFSYFLGIVSGVGLYKNATPILRVLGLFSTGNTVRLTKTFDAPVPILILEPAHRYNMWRSRMRAFLFHAEMCRTPCNARDLQARTGLTRVRQAVYIDVLKTGKVVDIQPRSTGVWLMSWDERRRALATLPYPTEYDPPNFRTLGVSTDSTDSEQNRQNIQ